MLGVILAGGNGTRFSENGCCKPLLRVNGKYLIEYSLDNLVRLHVNIAVIVVGKYQDEIRAALGSNYKGISLFYAVQEIPAGCIHALYSSLPFWSGEPVILQLSDEIYIRFSVAAAEKALTGDFACGYTMVKDKEKVKENYAIQCTGPEKRLIRCVEKPRTVQNNKKGTGFCVFQPSCISLLNEQYAAACDHFVTLCDFMNILIDAGKTGIAVPIAEEEININTPDKIQYAEGVLRGLTKYE